MVPYQSKAPEAGKKMRAIIRYPGSKWGLADWIISHFPENYDKMVYLEPFCGSGAVFFNKIPGASGKKIVG